jgi:hypothetical protein
MIWLLEQDTFGYSYFNAHREMCEAVVSSGYKVIEHKKLMYGKSLEFPGEYEIVLDSLIARGSIDFIRTCQKCHFFPGDWVNWPQLTFCHAALIFGKEMLNNDFVVLPYKELKRRRGQMRKIFGYKLFLRPDSGMKQFAGHAASVDEYELLRNPVNCGDSQLVIVASAKPIAAEYRVLVVDGKCVAASRYMVNHELYMSALVPHGVMEYVDDLLKDGVADNFPAVFIIDVAESAEGDYKILEVNGFNCSELYMMDYSKVVEAVSQVAYREKLESPPISFNSPRVTP